MGDCRIQFMIFNNPIEKSNRIYTHKKFKKSASVDDTIRGGGYTTSSTCTSTTTTSINPPPSPCTTQRRKNPRGVAPTAQRNNTTPKVVKPIAVKPIEQLKPFPSVSTSSNDRIHVITNVANSQTLRRGPVILNHPVSDILHDREEKAPPNITIPYTATQLPILIPTNLSQFSNQIQPHVPPEPQPHIHTSLPTPLQPPLSQLQPAPPPHPIQARPTKPVTLPAHVVAKLPPGNSGSGGQLITSGDQLLQIPGQAVINSPTNEQPLDLSVKHGRDQVPSRSQTQRRSRGDSSDKKGKHAKIEDLVPQALLEKLGFRDYEQLKNIDIKKLNQLFKTLHLTHEEVIDVREAHRKLKNRGYAKNSRQKDEQTQGEMKTQMAIWREAIDRYDKYASNSNEADEIERAILQELFLKKNLKLTWSPNGGGWIGQ